jgi:hypothetical protein
MLLLTGCASAVLVEVVTDCVAIAAPPLEIVNMHAKALSATAKQWVIDLDKLYTAWENPKICTALKNIGKLAITYRPI